MKLSDNELNAIREYFHDKPVVKAFLFGSFSREDAIEESDIDILVELDYSKHIGLGFVNMKYELEEKLHKKVDLVSVNAIFKISSTFY